LDPSNDRASGRTVKRVNGQKTKTSS
jgi:hypothetical protein